MRALKWLHLGVIYTLDIAVLILTALLLLDLAGYIAMPASVLYWNALVINIAVTFRGYVYCKW